MSNMDAPKAQSDSDLEFIYQELGLKFSKREEYAAELGRRSTALCVQSFVSVAQRAAAFMRIFNLAVTDVKIHKAALCERAGNPQAVLSYLLEKDVLDCALTNGHGFSGDKDGRKKQAAEALLPSLAINDLSRSNLKTIFGFGASSHDQRMATKILAVGLIYELTDQFRSMSGNSAALTSVLATFPETQRTLLHEVSEAVADNPEVETAIRSVLALARKLAESKPII